MNNQDIFHVVNEVSYVLSLSNEPQQLVEIVLDRLFQVLAVDSCWIQLVDPDSRRLRLVACRGFTADMKQTSGLRESESGLSSRVVMGLKTVITDLSRDGVYGLAAFSDAGLRSVLAVPIRTYRTHGLIGLAGRGRKQFPAESSDLLSAIAGMIGAALNTAELGRMRAAAEGGARALAATPQESAAAVASVDAEAPGPPTPEGGESPGLTGGAAALAVAAATGGDLEGPPEEVAVEDADPGTSPRTPHDDHGCRMARFRRQHPVD